MRPKTDAKRYSLFQHTPAFSEQAVKTVFPLWALFFALIWAVAQTPFFWDTVQLGSQHAHFFYENQFQHFFLPNHLDSGHFPAFGMYLAALWLFFGKSLFVSHFAMLPFVFGLVWQAYRLVAFFVSEKQVFPAVLLLLADATLLGQSLLISPDLVLVVFLFASLNAILYRKEKRLVFWLIGLVVISLRGMMCAALIAAIHVWVLWQKNTKFSLKTFFAIVPFYLPAALLGLGFLAWHYIEKGWIGYHADSPWGEHFQKVSLREIPRNIAVLIWRLLDFGRIAIWIVAAFFAFLFYKKKWHFDFKLKLLLGFFLLALLFLSPSVVLHKNLSSHRYLLPIMLLFSLLIIYVLFQKINKKTLQKWIYGVLLAALLTGNFWVYPPKIAQGWDGSLAYLPFFQAKKEMIAYIEKEDIPFEAVGSAFPNLAQMKFYYLQNDPRQLSPKNLQTQNRILYSNVCNSFSDSEIEKLKNYWIVEKEVKIGWVWVVLYKKGAMPKL